MASLVFSCVVHDVQLTTPIRIHYQAKKEVDELRKKLADAQAEETTAVDKAVTDAAAAVDPDSPEELAKWTAELGDKGDAAAMEVSGSKSTKLK